MQYVVASGRRRRRVRREVLEWLALVTGWAAARAVTRAAHHPHSVPRVVHPLPNGGSGDRIPGRDLALAHAGASERDRIRALVNRRMPARHDADLWRRRLTRRPQDDGEELGA